MIKFTVQGKPCTLKRHRTGKRGNYDPSKKDKDVFLMQCKQYAPRTPFAFPVHVYLQFHFDNHAHEPDIDNCIKFVFDAGNKIFWKDDKYIERVTAVKCFNGNARTEIVIRDIDHENES
jgi:Holliday junction resolvase RusA-like endonuclease